MKLLDGYFKEEGKEAVFETLRAIFGRGFVARLGRFLWQRGSLEYPNDFERNGEALMQRRLMGELGRREELCVFDVGANVGEWSRQLLEVVRRRDYRGHIDLHLFEPASAAAAKIEEELGGRNGVTAHVVPAAVADESGTAELNVRAPTAGTNSLRTASDEHLDGRAEVEVVTVDEYCRDHGIEQIDWMKVDTEGNDANVLEGAEELFADGRIRYVQFEYNWRWILFRHYLRDAFELADRTDYKIAKVTPEGLEVYEDWDFDLERFYEANFLMFPAGEPPPVETFEWWKTKCT